MANLNRVFLMGNLTRDPELRYTPSGTPVCEFGMAMNRKYSTRDGEQRDETCFVDVTMWGRRGVVISEYFSKGRPIFIEGRLKYDTWESSEGRRSKMSVVAENFEFLDGPSANRSESSGRAGRRSEAEGGPAGGKPPQQQQQQEEQPDEGFDVSEDEIPF